MRLVQLSILIDQMKVNRNDHKIVRLELGLMASSHFLS